MAMTTENKLKTAGLAAILVPIGVLMLFAIGESTGGDMSGLFHLVQVAPFVLAAVLVWKWPRVAGLLVLAVVASVFIIYPALLDFVPVVIGGLLAAVSGLLFLAASWFRNRDGTGKDTYAKNVQKTA